MAEMLTRTQRERLKKRRGKPFDRWLESVEPPTASPLRPKYAGPVVGMYDLELNYIVQPTVRTELKLTGTQTDVLLKARDDSMEGIESGKVRDGWAEKVHDMTDKALAVLSPEQRARFDQAMLQRRARISREALAGHPAAVAALKLTPIQLGDLKAGKSVEEVLSRDQLAKIDKLVGEEFPLPQFVVDDYLSAARRLKPADTAIRSDPHVTAARDFLRLANRLNLKDDQLKRLRELAEDEPKIRELIRKELSLDDTPPVAGAGRAVTPVAVVTELYREAVERQCWDVLDAQQQSAAKKVFGGGRR
jgi:hypothetical protein